MALETVSKNGVEIFSIGTFNGDRYTQADLQAMVDAFEKLGFEPPIKIGHEKGQEQPGANERLFGLPALGYVKNLYVRGNKLLADLKEIPKKFADLINAGAYRRISAEVYFDLKDEQTGKIWPRVLRAISFLGASIPALTNLRAIEELYNGNGAVVKSYEFTIGKEFQMETIQSNRPLSMSEVSRRAAEEIRAYASANKLAFRDAAHEVFAQVREDANAGFGPIAEIVQAAKMATGATGSTDWIGAVLAEIKRSGRAKAIAGECLTDKATEAAQRMTGQASANYPAALKDTMQKYPAAAEMWSSGKVSEEALREIFAQWFND